MKFSWFAALVIATAMAPAITASAAPTCAAGVHAAGCVGPNGAAVVRRPPPAARHTCAAGVHVAGCVGPNGAAVVRRPPAAVRCTIYNGRRVCR
jgi:hypothetical protein